MRRVHHRSVFQLRDLLRGAAVVGIALVAGVLLPGCSDDAGGKNRTDSDAFLGPPDKEAGSSESQANKKKGQDFLAENAKKPGVQTLPDGLQYLVLKEGTGKKPGPNDEVEVHYHGTLIDGTVFDSSVERGVPASFPVDRVIPGWTEVLQLMKEGSKWRVFIPSKLAYKSQGSPPRIGPNETLIFDIELLHVK
jgi:FKBP-type peptidyl-prolyl cis-trans isomerase FklB